jgi:hypothetical protein
VVADLFFTFTVFLQIFDICKKKQNVFAVMSDCYDELLRFAFLHSLKFWQQAKEKGRFRPSLVCYISAMVVNFFHTSAWRYASTHPFGTYSLQVVKVESVKPPSYSANEGGVSAFIYILASEGQYRKADGPIDSKLRERVTSFSEMQPWKV